MDAAVLAWAPGPGWHWRPMQSVTLRGHDRVRQGRHAGAAGSNRRGVVGNVARTDSTAGRSAILMALIAADESVLEFLVVSNPVCVSRCVRDRPRHGL